MANGQLCFLLPVAAVVTLNKVLLQFKIC